MDGQPPTLPVSITAAKRHVDQMTDDGKGFEEIEDYIDELPVSRDSKGVLWLFAWARQDRSIQESVLAASLIEATG